MCSDSVDHCQRSFSNLSTGRDTNIHCLVGNETTHRSVLGVTSSSDVEEKNIIDVDGVEDDDTIGSERRVPLDVYGSGVQGSHTCIHWCISRS